MWTFLFSIVYSPITHAPGQLDLLYLDCRWSFGALLDFETDTISFLEAFEARALNCAMVNKDVFAVFSRDESVTLLVVEPLYRTFRHLFDSFLNCVGSCAFTRFKIVKHRNGRKEKEPKEGRIALILAQKAGKLPGSTH
jgi:hypothetical protein